MAAVIQFFVCLLVYKGVGPFELVNPFSCSSLPWSQHLQTFSFPRALPRSCMRHTHADHFTIGGDHG